MKLSNNFVSISKSAYIVIIVLLLISAGCYSQPTPNVVFHGEMRANDEFAMNGEITTGCGLDANISDIDIELYSEEEELIHTIELNGRLSSTDCSNTSIPVNYTSETIPQYVVIDSEDFWKTDVQTRPAGYKKINNSYEVYIIQTKTDKIGTPLGGGVS